jgi:hypothetical protein
MNLIGLMLLIVGLPLALNLFRLDDRLAAFFREMPWWLKSLTADSPVSHRLTGWILVILGAAFLVASVFFHVGLR